MFHQEKSGQSTMVGNAGEYYVVAELLKRGVIAALSPRNMRAFDVLATRGGETVRIRVKTKSENSDVWKWTMGRSRQGRRARELFRALSPVADFTVLVHIAEDNRDLAFYVIPTETLDTWLSADFAAWLEIPSPRGRLKNPRSGLRVLSRSACGERLKPFLNDWDRLWLAHEPEVRG